ncbi:MAG TPA: acetate/propionate family kinase [Terriglobales bacterium]|nr:acetate/propionate family kinase [Terriglobales bacterium]
MAQDARQRILAINSGSSSLKVSLYQIGETEEAVLSLEVRRIGIPGGHMRAVNSQSQVLVDRDIDLPDHAAALSSSLAWLRDENHKFDAIGHRVVHGGPHFTEPQAVTPELMSALQELVPIDPDHLPQAIAAIEAVAREHPSLPQVACFDTSFHRQMPQVARICPLPLRFYDQGVQRYGFHGLSYEYVMSELCRLEGRLAAGRVVIAHLGNGASMAAIHHGRSVDTSMGFTPTAGLLMGTRCGDIDPGALLYLMEEEKMTAHAVNRLLNKESGLLGISGISEDMQDLLEREENDPHAALAVELFCNRAKKYLGAYAAALGGLDILVFTAGIGEHAPAVRQSICSGLDFLGIKLDPAGNRGNAPVISAKDSQVRVRVVKTNEELMIARHTARLVGHNR